ncbi:MAG: TolC family protein [Planctomycetes bacterium]|nr:TolC family protein [Planctomycetota bacterium]
MHATRLFRRPQIRGAWRILGTLAAVVAVAQAGGCHFLSPAKVSPEPETVEAGISDASHVVQTIHVGEVIAPPDSFAESADHPPPRVRDIATLTPWPMSLDEAVRTALENSPVIRDAGGMVVAVPEAARTVLDPALRSTDPNFGPEAALAAYDTQLESGFFWNGGGGAITSAFSGGALGNFSQPTTMAKLGLGKRLVTGTHIGLGGVGGYDESLAGGPYAAFGGELRQPLMRGAGTEVNRIAGALGAPGVYRGLWIAQIDADKAQLEVEQAIRDLVRDVSFAYWELHFAYRNYETCRLTLETTRQTWQREQRRVAEQAGRPDDEILAKQQYYAADAAVQNAISGTGPTATGIYNMETKFRLLLALPTSDGRLIRPTDKPLSADFRFDWNESLQLAQSRRVELRKQEATLEQRQLELKAARNLRKPQFDAVASFRQLGGEPDQSTATFSQALNGWQLGLEYRQALGFRRENAAIRHAELRVSRDQAVLHEARRQVAAELRTVFTELDRAYGVTQSLAVSRDAAKSRLQAEVERHAAGETQIERVFEAQHLATQAETAFERSLVDYNHAFVKVHVVRSSLLEVMGIGLAERSAAHEYVSAEQRPSVFALPTEVNSVPIEAPPASEEVIPAPVPSETKGDKPPILISPSG